MILTVVGARPQFIKAAPMSRALKQAGISEIVVHTGQHFDPQMSDVFFEELDLVAPVLNLNISGGTHGVQTGRMLESLEQALLTYNPSYVLVYGDTNSTLAGALAAAKLYIPVIHIEAGLRSFNRKMPEEINRVMTDHLSDLLFAPSKAAVENLKNEGIEESKIFQVGDIMNDTICLFKNTAAAKSSILSTVNIEKKAYYLATIHRPENTDHEENLSAIFRALNQLGQEKPCILPLHPRLQSQRDNFVKVYPHIQFIDPLSYLDMIQLSQNAEVILTDSGGLQKEAFFLKTPCITLRTETEWNELVEIGWNKVIQPQENLFEKIQQAISQFTSLKLIESYPYGRGDTAEKICQIIKSYYASSFNEEYLKV